MAKIYDFNYKYGEQKVVLPPGKYLLECWGAAGGGGCKITDTNLRSKGGYSKGELILKKETALYVYTGEKGSNYSPFNGGGRAMMHEGLSNGETLYCNGGGATDIRLVEGNWDNEQSLLSRIIVAGGGGRNNFETKGGDGGGDAGGDGFKADSKGTQTNGGKGQVGLDGSFGKGGSAVSASSGENYGGGGGGWYGGGSGYNAGGGSGYVLTENSYKPAGYIPTKEYWLENAVTTTGGGIAGEHGKAKITLIQGLPFLSISSYNSTQATFKAGHTEENKLSKIEWFIDDTLKETFTTDLYLEKTINYTLEDNALHTLKIIVTDINNMTCEQVVTISKSIMPLPADANLQDISTKLTEIGESFKNGKTSIINTLALKNIEASLNNTLVELSEKIKTSFDSGDASLQDLMNQLTQANNTITQLNSQFKVAGGTSVAQRNDGTKIAYEYKRSTTSKFGGWLKINGLAFKPNIFVADCEYYDSKNRVDYKFLTFACHGFTTSGKQDFVVVVVYSHSSGSDKYTGDGFIYNNNEGDVWFNANGVQVPAYLPGGSESFTYTWCAVKFMNT
ncbi:glycine rich domain-containing protein [Clostridioides difficile]|uniref:glycine rich domain-containing protein n=1 Tax=Clostridioides difficile TaxID=1496 RepID=UPI0009452DE1|nr:glycine rich domain-containing protein [Clostridioides difficile]